MSKNQNVINRFFDKVDLDESTGCWNFTSSIGKSNNGRFYYNHKCWDAYVIGYILLGGEIPKGYDLHHICENRLCVNPEHLLPTTRDIHLVELTPTSIAYKNNRKTHCPKGHPLTGDNLVKGSVSGRHCRICAVKRSGDFRKAKRKREIANGAAPYKRNKFELHQLLEMRDSKEPRKVIMEKYGVSGSYLSAIKTKLNLNIV